MSGALHVLGPDAIARLGLVEAIDALEAALIAGLDVSGQPARSAVRVEPGEMLIMPGIAGEHFVLKAVTLGADGPRVQGACIVFERSTLAPVAVLDGPALTARRTAAVSGLAARHLARADAHRLVVFGSGPQGQAHIEVMRAVRPIERVTVLGRRDRGDVDRAVADADIICCCTTSAEPLFDGSLVADGALVVAVGSHQPQARETDHHLMARAAVVVEDVETALLEAGDVICAIERGALAAADLVTLSDLVAGVTLSPTAPRVFKSVGMGWEDAVVGAAVVARHPLGSQV